MATTELPRYRVLERCFIQPNKIEPESIISTDLPPAKHLEPLNTAAKAKMEEYYSKEYEVVDDYGNPKKVKPNEGFRPPSANQPKGPKPPTVILHREPPAGSGGEIIGVLDRPLQPNLVAQGDEAAVFDEDEDDDPDDQPLVKVEHAAPAKKGT